MAMLKKTGVAGGACVVMTIIGIVVSHGQVRTNEAGLELIGNAEACRRSPYVCPAGELTDGIGNTHNVHYGTVKTDQQIADDWQKNIKIAETCVNDDFRGRDMNNNEFSAMASAAFNLGCNGLRYYLGSDKKPHETSIYLDAQKENWPAMCSHLPDFDHGTVNGKSVVLTGLKTRRDKERTLCLKAIS
jgi:lysozyme